MFFQYRIAISSEFQEKHKHFADQNFDRTIFEVQIKNFEHVRYTNKDTGANDSIDENKY